MVNLLVKLKNVMLFVGVLTVSHLYCSDKHQGVLSVCFFAQPCCQRQDLERIARETAVRSQKDWFREFQQEEIRGRAEVYLLESLAFDGIKAEFLSAKRSVLSEYFRRSRHDHPVLPFSEFSSVEDLPS